MSSYQKLILGALAPALWGTTYVIVNLNLKEATPIWVAVFRALPAGLLILLFKPQGFPISSQKMWLLSFLNISIFFLLLFIAAYRLPGSIAGTLAALFPMALILLSWLLYGIKPKNIDIISSVIGFIGVGMLLNPINASQSPNLIGVLASLLAMSLFALCTLWIRRWQVKNMLGLTAWQLVLGGVILIPIAIFFEGQTPTVVWRMTPAIFWLIVLNTTVAYTAFIYSAKKLDTQVLGLLALLNPAVAVITGVLIANEEMDPVQYLGIGLIIIALIAVVKQERIKLFFSNHPKKE